MKKVRFLQNRLPYAAGEGAAFEDDVADELIRTGAALEMIEVQTVIKIADGITKEVEVAAKEEIEPPAHLTRAERKAAEKAAALGVSGDAGKRLLSVLSGGK